MPGPKKKSKGGNRKNNIIKSRRLEDITKDFDAKTFEVYGQVTKPLGDRRFRVNVQKLNEPSEIAEPIICSIKGSYRRRINTDMFVLVKLYEFNTKQGQIIDSYSPDEILALKEIDKWDYPEGAYDIDYKLRTDDIDLPDNSDESETESESRDDMVEDPDFDIDAI